MTRDDRQKECVRKWISAKCRGTLECCTGFGKTRIALMAIKAFLKKNNGTILVVVPTEHLKVQWMQILNKEEIDCSVEIINSVIKKTYEGITFLILDECHRMASNTFFDVFESTDPIMVLGLSATFERIDGREELLNHFCPVIDTVSIKEATSNGWLSPYKEYKISIDVDLTEYFVHHNKFLNHFSFFDFKFDLAMKCVTNIITRRWYAKHIGCEEKEVAAHAFGWNTSLRKRKEFVMNHPKKLEIAKQILEARKDKKAITFCATIKQAESFGFGYIVHSKESKKRNRISMEKFALLDKGVIHSSRALNEGVDMPGLSVAVILHNTSSKTSKTQRVGRVIRFEEGKEAEVFTLVIKGTMEEQWFNNSTSGKSYIEISDRELADILSGEVLDNKIEKEEFHKPDLFRF